MRNDAPSDDPSPARGTRPPEAGAAFWKRRPVILVAVAAALSAGVALAALSGVRSEQIATNLQEDSCKEACTKVFGEFFDGECKRQCESSGGGGSEGGGGGSGGPTCPFYCAVGCFPGTDQCIPNTSGGGEGSGGGGTGREGGSGGSGPACTPDTPCSAACPSGACGNGLTCVNGRCGNDPYECRPACAAGQICSTESGQPRCITDVCAKCSSDEYCMNSACYACSSDPSKCAQSERGCTSDTQCDTNQRCDTTTRTCEADLRLCTSDAQCSNGLTCVQGRCGNSDTVCSPPCTGNTSCDLVNDRPTCTYDACSLCSNDEFCWADACYACSTNPEQCETGIDDTCGGACGSNQVCRSGGCRNTPYCDSHPNDPTCEEAPRSTCQGRCGSGQACVANTCVNSAWCNGHLEDPACQERDPDAPPDEPTDPSDPATPTDPIDPCSTLSAFPGCLGGLGGGSGGAVTATGTGGRVTTIGVPSCAPSTVVVGGSATCTVSLQPGFPGAITELVLLDEQVAVARGTFDADCAIDRTSTEPWYTCTLSGTFNVAGNRRVRVRGWQAGQQFVITSSVESVVVTGTTPNCPYEPTIFVEPSSLSLTAGATATLRVVAGNGATSWAISPSTLGNGIAPASVAGASALAPTAVTYTASKAGVEQLVVTAAHEGCASASVTLPVTVTAAATSSSQPTIAAMNCPDTVPSGSRATCSVTVAGTGSGATGIALKTAGGVWKSAILPLASCADGACTLTTTDGITAQLRLYAAVLNATGGEVTNSAPGVVVKVGAATSSVAKAPQISPSSTSFVGSTVVTIESNEPDAMVYYTLDGSDPDEGSRAVVGPLTLTATTTVKARAFQPGKTMSPVASRTYTEQAAAADPTFSPESGSYAKTQRITLSSTTSGATIRYTTDGTTPTLASAEYEEPIKVAATTTVRARAWVNGAAASGVASASYIILPASDVAVAAPTMTPPPGTFDAEPRVSLATTTQGATIRYTLDGSDPSPTSEAYATPLVLTQDTTVRAQAFKSGMRESDVAKGAYVVTLKVAPPVADPGTGAYERTVTVRLSTTTEGAVVHYTTDGSDPTSSSPTYSDALTFGVGTTTLRAVATKGGWAASEPTVATYTVAAPAPLCGNGRIDAGESCDDTLLGGKTCADFPPFTAGTLRCADYCGFDLSGCGQTVSGSAATPPPATCTRPVRLSFTTNRTSIVRGSKAKLTWSAQNAASVGMKPLPGKPLQTSGTLEVSPTVTTTYTLTAAPEDGACESESVEVRVTVTAG